MLENPQQTPFQLVVINDASPNPEMAPMLEALAEKHDNIELHHNPENLGFVGTVNRGMQLHPGRDLVLLNADAEVANDWLDRLVRAAHGHPRAATVTPFSNNATICSFPRFCEYNPLPAGWSLQELDSLFARINAGETVEIPTGVGFCMYIRRDSLDEVGLFDTERFGRGYGEENDFCRRAAKAGWKNLLCADTYVFHDGGVSFSDEQEERIGRAQEILDRLHPDYHALVQKHVQEDPAGLLRFRVLLEMYRSSPRRKVLHLTHHLGGGTLKHIQELAEHLRDSMDALLLRPGHDGFTRLIFGPDPESFSLAFDLPADYPLLKKVLRHLGLDRLHYHHTLGLETSVWGLPEDLDLPFDITLHDYYFINAHPTQTDARGRYQPELERQQSSYPLPTTLEEWQRNQRLLLEKAERIIAPSRAAAEEMARHYPELSYTVAHHPDAELHGSWPDVRPVSPGDGPLRILVLGALSLEKGADLLEETAMAAQKAGLPLEFHLLGYSYRPLHDSVVTHGAYSHEELPARIAAIAPHLIWFTALWPETYSYTLSEALTTGLPIVVPDLGAFPERVEHRPLTWVAPWNRTPSEWLRFFISVADTLKQEPRAVLSWGNQPQQNRPAKNFYRDHYLTDNRAKPLDQAMTEEEAAALYQHSRTLASGGEKSRREALLRHLLILRQSRVGRLVSRLVPVKLQRKIKRKLSAKPVHEIIE